MCKARATHARTDNLLSFSLHTHTHIHTHARARARAHTHTHRHTHTRKTEENSIKTSQLYIHESGPCGACAPLSQWPSCKQSVWARCRGLLDWLKSHLSLANPPHNAGLCHHPAPLPANARRPEPTPRKGKQKSRTPYPC